MQERPSLATTRSVRSSRFKVDQSEFSFAEEEGDEEAETDSPRNKPLETPLASGAPVDPPPPPLAENPEADFLNLALKFLDQAARR